MELKEYMEDERNKTVYRLELGVLMALWDKLTGPFQSSLAEGVNKQGKSGMLVKEAKNLVRDFQKRFDRLLATEKNQLAAALFADSETSPKCTSLFKGVIRPEWEEYKKFHSLKIRKAKKKRVSDSELLLLANEEQRIESAADGGIRGMMEKFQKDTRSLLELDDSFDDKHLILTNRAVESTFGIEKSIERSTIITCSTTS